MFSDESSRNPTHWSTLLWLLQGIYYVRDVEGITYHALYPTSRVAHELVPNDSLMEAATPYEIPEYMDPVPIA